MKKTKWYMFVCKFNVDKQNNKEIWKNNNDINTCNEIIEFFNTRSKGKWKRIKHVFYFENLNDAMDFKFNYYDNIKYVKFLDKNMEEIE